MNEQQYNQLINYINILDKKYNFDIVETTDIKNFIYSIKVGDAE